MPKIKGILKLTCISAFLATSCNSSRPIDSGGSGKKYQGFVPDAETAKKIAKAVWLPIYGPSVLNERPYNAKVVGDSIWIVQGVLESDKEGGTAYIEISIKSGTILKVEHGK